MMRLEKDITNAVRAIRPNAKSVMTKTSAKLISWSIRDGSEIISHTSMGRRAAWIKALSTLRKQDSR